METCTCPQTTSSRPQSEPSDGVVTHWFRVCSHLFTHLRILNVSGEYLAKNGIATFACSETQKFGHVTFFWNGNRSGFFDAKLETYLEVLGCGMFKGSTPTLLIQPHTA